jgi:hypothetical protein
MHRFYEAGASRLQGLSLSQEFEDHVRAELKKVPLASRKFWEERNLQAWWEQLKGRNPSIERGCSSANSWSKTKGACQGLYGERATG